MKPTTFRSAIKSGEIDDSFVEQYMCPICPWTTGEVSRPRIGDCEGKWCEEAYDDAMAEEGVVD